MKETRPEWQTRAQHSWRPHPRQAPSPWALSLLCLELGLERPHPRHLSLRPQLRRPPGVPSLLHFCLQCRSQTQVFSSTKVQPRCRQLNACELGCPACLLCDPKQATIPSLALDFLHHKVCMTSGHFAHNGWKDQMN